MYIDFMAFIGVLVAAPTALAIWLAVEHGKRADRADRAEGSSFDS